MRLFSPISGDDVFISYSRKDGGLYAAGLADKLTEKGLSCFIDKLGTEPNHDLPLSLRKKIRSCSVFVLIGTEKAAQSAFVQKEIAEFKKTRRTILPIGFGDAVNDAVWYEEIPGLAVEGEKDLAALETGNPSPNVVNFIEKSFKYTRRNQHMARMFWGALILVLTLTGVGGGASYYAATNIALAKASDASAKEAAKRAVEETQKAAEAKAEADKQKGIAAEEKIKAEKAGIIAEEKKQLADAATRRANQEKARAAHQEQIANEQAAKAQEATKKAIRQESIAETRRLVNESDVSLEQKQPQLLRDAFLKSYSANKQVDHFALSLTEPISSLRNVLSFTPKLLSRSEIPMIDPGAACDKYAFSVNQAYFACQKQMRVTAYKMSDLAGPPVVYNLNKDDLVLDGDAPAVEIPGVYTRTRITDECKECEVSHVSISDAGVIGLSFVNKSIDEEGEPDGTPDKYGIVVLNARQGSFHFETDDVQSVSVSPGGDMLMFADINHSDSDHDLDISHLNLLRLGGTSEILECQYSRQVSIIQAGNFSPNGRRFVSVTTPLGSSSALEMHEYVVDVPKSSIACKRSPMMDTDPDAVSDYFVRSYKIDSGLGTVAVNNAGDMIAIQTDGVSVWSLSPIPNLLVLVPFETLSIGWTASDKDVSTFSNNKSGFLHRTWSDSGYQSESLQEFQHDTDLAEMSGYLTHHPDFITTIDGSTIVVKRRSDAAIVDFIVLKNLEVDEVAISTDGRELVSKSHDPSGAAQSNEELNGYRDYSYEKWKIGYKSLGGLYNERLCMIKAINR